MMWMFGVRKCQIVMSDCQRETLYPQSDCSSLSCGQSLCLGAWGVELLSGLENDLKLAVLFTLK